MDELRVSVSGIRGKVGSSFVPESVVNWITAYGTWLGGGKVAVGADSRTSNEMMRSVCTGGLLATGCEVIDLGVLPTPSLGVAVRKLGMAGGISITASHNPIEWNGLKFFTEQGTVLNASAFEKFLQVYESGERNYVGWDGFRKLSTLEDPCRPHREAVMNMSVLDTAAIKRRRFRVAVDCFHGAGGELIPGFLKELHCEVFTRGCEMDGRFEGDPEPRSENLVRLGALVRDNDCAFGAAVDPDADRLALVDERGEAITEELTLALAVKLFTRHKKGNVVANLSTSLVTHDAAVQNGCVLHRSKIGEINVVDMMREVDAVIGGEGNGGVIVPEVHYGRDALTGIAMILQLLCEDDNSLSAQKGSLPDYYLHKQKLPLNGVDLAALSEVLQNTFSDWKFDLRDGYHASKDGQWFQLRASNTEPIIRLFVEAGQKQQAIDLARQIEDVVRSG
jgi:phosphomannomutase